MNPPPRSFQKTIASETRSALSDLTGVGVGAVVAALYTGAISHTPIVGVGAFLGVFSVGMPQLYRRLHAVAAHTINTSFNYIGLGKLNEASRLLDDAEARPHFMWVRRLVDVQRAIIAMRRGLMAEARDRLDSAIARPLGLVERANSLYQIEGAYALRAFARASLGDREAALEDIHFVRSRGTASLDALAKVALAEALLLERAGERARLKELIDREETLLLEHTHPRERAIVRGLQRMLRTSAKASIYRQTAPSDDAMALRDEPPLADWVAKIAPDIAPFVRVPRRSTDGSPAMIAAGASVVPKAAAIKSVAAAHAARAKPRRSAALLWVPAVVLGAALIAALGRALSSVRDAAPAVDALFPGTGSLNPLVWLVPLIALSIGGVVAVGLTQVKRAREKLRERSRSQRPPRVDQPTDTGSAQGLTAIALGPSDVAAAQARLVLAGNAERRGDLEAAITECRLGIGRLMNPKSRAEADILFPDLIALAAFTLAASGRSDEADAELALLSPGYPHHARAVFRVRLVQAVRRGDLGEAARWVDQGAADLPLSIREELLADIVRALHAPSQAGAGEIERIKDELRQSDERRRWLDVVAPGIVASFERSGEVDINEAQPAPREVAPRLRVEANPGAGDQRSVVDAEAAAAELEAEAEAEERLAPRPGRIQE